jgi:endonuclease G
MASRPPRTGSKGTFILLFLGIAAVLVVLYLYQARRHDVPPPGTGSSGAQTVPSSPAAPGLALPAPAAGDALVRHEGYTLGYRADAAAAAWVAYMLTGTELAATNAPRTNNFRPDPLLRGRQGSNADFEGSGYDRGHLAPAEDLSYSRNTMSESFYYSNMSPQVPAFNRGVWKRLEELVRFWATAYDTVYIVTGPLLEPGLPAIGPHRVAVPRQYYKAVLLYGRQGVRAIGFLLRNEASAATLKSFAVPVDELERLTGLDLFPQLPDSIEDAVERDPAINEWKWRRGK